MGVLLPGPREVRYCRSRPPAGREYDAKAFCVHLLDASDALRRQLRRGWVGTPDAIRVNRVKLGLTQAQLAREIGVDTRQINRYETGETEPTLAIARRLADRLRITM